MGKAKAYELSEGALWPKTPSGSPLEIEVFGATGEYASGKTLLGLSIAPGCHKVGAFEGKARTLILDFEKSGGTYGGTGCLRIDVPTALLTANIDYTPMNVFTWFLSMIEKLQPGQFDVLLADPVSDIEGGLVEYVKKNCEKFGLTKNQVEKGGGLLWGAVKDYWKQVLLKLSAKCKCFYFTSHLRDEWKGNTPTGKREPKGKETLMELASLYLWLERKADSDGKVPAIPSAIVLKQRLADTSIDEDGMLVVRNLLPPRLPEASVSAIRGYIANPPDYAKLKTTERVIEEQMKEEDRLRLELARAEADRETQTSKLAILSRQAELRSMDTQARLGMPQTPDASAIIQAAKQVQREVEAVESADATDKTPPFDVPEKEEEKPAAKAPNLIEQAFDSAAAKAKAEADASLAAMMEKGDRLAAATKSQCTEIVELANKCNLSAETLASLLGRVGAKDVTELKREHALLLIEKLRAKLVQLGK